MMKCIVNNEEGECVGVFLLVEVQKYYKLRDPEERLNTEFVVKFYEFHDTSRLLSSWWKEDKKFTNRSNDWYNMVNLKRALYLFNGFNLPIIWGKRLLQVFRSMDALGI
jgi:hypothetical protein